MFETDTNLRSMLTHVHKNAATANMMAWEAPHLQYSWGTGGPLGLSQGRYFAQSLAGQLAAPVAAAAAADSCLDVTFVVEGSAAFVALSVGGQLAYKQVGDELLQSVLSIYVL